MKPEKILEKFSTHLKNVIARAISLAAGLEQDEVTTLHLLFGIGEEAGSVGAEIMARFKLEPKKILSRLEQGKSRRVNRRELLATKTMALPTLNQESKKTLERAMLLAYECGHRHVGTEHLLYGLLRSGSNEIKELTEAEGLSPAAILEELEMIFQSTTNFPDITEVQETIDHLAHLTEGGINLPLLASNTGPATLPLRRGKSQSLKRPTGALELFTVNLTDPTRAQTADPVIGREKEITRLMQILCRRTKNNPVLVGEAGVGKTAIVEGLAKLITSQMVPEVLKRKQILSLDLALLISGTIYRGEFESRLKQIIDEITANPDLILFIDELHNIIGAGSNGGTMDAANILKPALARGQLRCIGATTIDEYAKYITTDPALERRFQAINVAEPNREQVKAILVGLKSHYEDFHRVLLSADALQAAVEFSAKYLHDNFLPDKAIDLMDEAAAAVGSRRPPSESERRLFTLKEELDHCQQNKEAAIHQEQFERALELKKQEANLLLLLEKARQTEVVAPKDHRPRVTRTDVAKIVEQRLDIPLSYLLQDEWERLAELPARLNDAIRGQAVVVANVVETLRHAHLRLGRKEKPFASFLFVGPSGVGKTELARVLARALYHDEAALLKLDMSEFSEAHGVSKILGSPAGYIGYRERNRFTDALRRRPYSVVLFDEFDKAHRDVQKLILQVLDTGELTDSHGKKIYFREAIVILTASLGPELYRAPGLGFGSFSTDKQIDAEMEKLIRDRLKEQLGGDVLNRVERTCIFLPLTREHVAGIVRQTLARFNEELTAAQALKLVPDAAAVETLAARAFTPDTGVRHAGQVIGQVVNELVGELLRKQRRKKQYTLTHHANRFVLR